MMNIIYVTLLYFVVPVGLTYYNVDTISLVTVAMETFENKPCVYLLMHFNVFYTYR